MSALVEDHFRPTSSRNNPLKTSCASRPNSGTTSFKALSNTRVMRWRSSQTCADGDKPRREPRNWNAVSSAEKRCQTFVGFVFHPSTFRLDLSLAWKRHSGQMWGSAPSIVTVALGFAAPGKSASMAIQSVMTKKRSVRRIPSIETVVPSIRLMKSLRPST